jgi:hypothetical protein
MTIAFEILVDILLLLPVAGYAAAIFLWRVYLSDEARPRSWVLFLLAFTSTLISTIGLAISALAAIRLSGQTLGFVGGLILVVVLVFLESIPIWHAITVWRRRRSGEIEIHNNNGTSSEVH